MTSRPLSASDLRLWASVISTISPRSEGEGTLLPVHTPPRVTLIPKNRSQLSSPLGYLETCAKNAILKGMLRRTRLYQVLEHIAFVSLQEPSYPNSPSDSGLPMTNPSGQMPTLGLEPTPPRQDSVSKGPTLFPSLKTLVLLPSPRKVPYASSPITRRPYSTLVPAPTSLSSK
jgi:hypothetical protein